MPGKTPNERVVDASSTDPRAQRTRAAIIRATGELLAAHRIAFSVQQVADLAGVSRASFYTHFSGIDDVMNSMLFATLGDIRDRYEAELLAGDVSPRQAMHNADALFVDAMWRNREVLAMLLRGPSRAEVREVIATGVANELGKSFARRISHAPAGIDVTIAARYVGGATAEIIAAWVTGDIDATPERILQHFDELMPRWMFDPTSVID